MLPFGNPQTQQLLPCWIPTFHPFALRFSPFPQPGTKIVADSGERSLKLSEIGQKRARLMLRAYGLTQKAIAEERGIASWSTVNKFFNGKPIDRIIFQEICNLLDLDLETVIELPELSPTPSHFGSPAPAVSDTLLSQVQHHSQSARTALTPRILHRIPRTVVREKYLPAIQRGLSGQQRIIPIIAPAGCGKSTILGDLYDELTHAETGWVGLVLCSTLSLTVSYMHFVSYGFVASTFAMPGQVPSSYSADNPSVHQQALIDDAFGKGLCGENRGLVEVVTELAQAQGRGVLLIDTLDLLVNRDFVPTFRLLLEQIVAQGVTIVFTCRDHEYNDFLEPLPKRLLGLAQSVDRYTVPNFSTDEIRLAVDTFVSKLDLAQSPQGQTFAGNILTLSTDSRSLQEIIQNPLLLALLCELFAKEGQVPPDLTVSKLYQRYWKEKVTYSRVDKSSFAPLALEKDKLCLTIAQTLFSLSQSYLYESIYRDELGIEFTKLVLEAYNDLLSEGVIEHLPSGKLHFFHQTLLEYAIAYWLTRASAQPQRDQLLNSLSNPDTIATHWLPVIRQYLTIVDSEAEFTAVVDQFDLSQVGLFGTVAYAATSRERPDALVQLLPIALSLGQDHQQRLYQALEAAPRSLIDAGWPIFLSLLKEGTHSVAVNTAKTMSGLIVRWWDHLKKRLPEAFEALANRTLERHVQPSHSDDDRLLVLNWLLQDTLEPLAQSPEPFAGEVAHVWLMMLKVIAHDETTTTDWPLLQQQSRQLLRSFDLMSIQLGETETIDLLGAISRHQPTFLQEIVVHDCSKLMKLNYRHNVSSVVKAIRQVEGTTSSLFDDVVAAEWCDSEIESVVFKVKGI